MRYTGRDKTEIALWPATGSRIDAFYRLPSGVAHKFVTFLRMKAMID